MQPIKAWAELLLSRDVTQGEALLLLQLETSAEALLDFNGPADLTS